jgi:hypothetical protein
LRRARGDAFFVCARNRETTRALLDRIAELLADRWAEAETRHPATRNIAGDESLDPNGNGAAGAEPEAPPGADENSLTTLEEMLGSPRRKRHRSRAPA